MPSLGEHISLPRFSAHPSINKSTRHCFQKQGIKHVALFYLSKKIAENEKLLRWFVFLLKTMWYSLEIWFFLIQLRQTVNAYTRDWKFERIFKDIINWSVINKAQKKIVKASKTYYNTTQCDLHFRNIAQNCSDYKPLKLIAIQFTAAILNYVVSNSYYWMLSTQLNAKLPRLDLRYPLEHPI